MQLSISLVGPTLYVAGTLLLLPGCTLLLDRYAQQFYAAAIYFLVAATALLTTAAIADFAVAARSLSKYYKASNYIDDAAAQKLTAKLMDADEEEETQGSPNLLVPYLMLQGGILFLAGSILYLPSVARNVLGTWVFRTGTCSYLAGSFFSWRALAKSPGGVFSNCRVFFGILAFIAGALLYLAGGILSEMHLPGFAETWVAGSIFFVAGALAFASSSFAHHRSP